CNPGQQCPGRDSRNGDGPEYCCHTRVWRPDFATWRGRAFRFVVGGKGLDSGSVGVFAEHRSCSCTLNRSAAPGDGRFIRFVVLFLLGSAAPKESLSKLTISFAG